MNKFEIKVFSLKSTSVLKIEAEEEIGTFVLELLSLFAKEIDVENLKMQVDQLQSNTDELKQKVAFFVESYKVRFPQLNRFKIFFDKMNANEWFFIFPNNELSSEQIIYLSNYLVSLNENKDFREIDATYKEIFQCVLNNYNILAYDTTHKRKIGEGLKENRICRFCKRKQPEVTFSKEAHAISEALGNKALILNEECDTCNEMFDEQIERDIIHYFSIYRTFFGIKGKEKVPKLKGVNFIYEHKGNNQIVLAYSDSSHQKAIGEKVPENVEMQTNEELALQNIYKSLCKFALSIVDTRYINHFDETIRWIKNDKKYDKLPQIAVLASYHFFDKHPNLVLYTRINDNKELPYMVGEFHFTYLTYVFIVPFSNQDGSTFTDDATYNNFWECFQHYKRSGDWRFNDFSDSTKKKLTFNIIFKKNTEE